MKRVKVSPQLITDRTTAHQKSYTLFPDERQRLADFFSLLAVIDRENKSKKQREECGL